jgi:serine/threonine protein kinase
VVESTISHYKILKKIGQGGMGEVYLAEDTRLQRKVAVKVLPGAVASIPEGLARFEREAQTAAALNHPNIATIYDVGSDARPDGSQVYFIVQEYLEGQTLQELLKHGRLSLQKALSWAVEIAQGLAAINAAGIVHRDLKPGNIFITSAGHLKILDFGLAKLTQPVRTEPDEANSPTLTFSTTGIAAGQLIGTPGYMAPEQFSDSEVDQRADIFAFGTVLFEMLSGHHPFEGKTIHSTIHRILSEPPIPFNPLDSRLPLRLQWILEKCLQKDPAARYQHSSDLLVDLRATSASPVEPAAMPPKISESKIAGKWLAIIAVAFLCGNSISATKGKFALGMVQQFPLTEPWSSIATLGRFGSVTCMPSRLASWKGPKERDSHFGRRRATTSPTSPKVSFTRFPRLETASARCVVFRMICGEAATGAPRARSCSAKVRAEFTKLMSKAENRGKS